MVFREWGKADTVTYDWGQERGTRLPADDDTLLATGLLESPIGRVEDEGMLPMLFDPASDRLLLGSAELLQLEHPWEAESVRDGEIHTTMTQRIWRPL